MQESIYKKDQENFELKLKQKSDLFSRVVKTKKNKIRKQMRDASKVISEGQLVKDSCLHRIRALEDKVVKARNQAILKKVCDKLFIDTINSSVFDLILIILV